MDFNFDKTSRKPLVKKIITEGIIWIIELAVVIGLAYFVVNFTIERTTMLGVSMSPTLVDQDKIIINKFAYKFNKPERFDIIVFKQSGNEHSYYNIKRIIGLPGETINITDGNVYVNGELLEEPMVIEPITNSGLAAEEITLDKNEYFVLGDNRNNSEDSRFANIGNILSNEIIGKAWIRTNNFNFVNKLNLKREEK
ncbi:signal peptidase I [Anaerocolumna aminovalerica]|jgi:signal peptidase I|uniref:Signal peptidase I n=1 Tax=Anaerocolumna aminovalerica TaxID=1527 RepID=A0A1I5CLR4_9FIRM|nr:signal peptidase I [Anaerocolumna aminovalerica]MDU6265656.1 signal peptidase I [Anaerocolumna aminovalerica]SFN87857.1 signal peptidase I [Anaerocolumna aminovalerica]